MENLIYNELKYRGYNIDVGMVFIVFDNFTFNLLKFLRLVVRNSNKYRFI